MYNIAVDIGGTFTDCAVLDLERNRITTAKAPSMRADLAGGVLGAIRLAAEKIGVPVEQVLGGTERFIHGSTVATNAMIERDGSRTAYLTTAGHEDTLAIGKIYQKRAGLTEREVSHLNTLEMADPPLVDRDLVFGVEERVDYKGRTIVPLSDDEIARVVRQVADSGVDSVAVCLLWSFLAPEHERRVADAIAAALPDVFVSASVDVAPVLGEYERGVTTALNAYLGPPIARYLGGLQELLDAHGLRSPVLMMTAEGGVVPISRARRRPVSLLDSGPVGGALGSRFQGRAYDERNVICTDVGGTSFDVALVVDDQLQLDNEPVIAQYVFKIPKIGVKSIGAGGGSIAWVDDIGVLKVGPQSAGALPGPACYGRGGTLPTVTDANLILGYLNADNFLGGTMRLDRDAAVRAFAPLAERLGQTVEETAAGVHRIMNAHMADLLRSTTIENGHDPREFVLFAYGGAAATHAVGYSAEAGVKGIYVLGDATAFSAVGMLTADLSYTFDRARPMVSPFAAADLTAADGLFAELRSTAEQALRDSGESVADASFRRIVLMRFQAQVHELEIEVPGDGPLDDRTMDELTRIFTERYELIYGAGSAYPDAGVEIVTFRMTATVPTQVRELPGAAPAAGDVAAAATGARPAYFDGHGFTETRVYDGERLGAGHRIAGPAVVERYGDTVLIPPDFTAEVDPQGSLFVTVPEGIAARDETVRTADGPLDPVTYEVIRNRLWGINDEQAQTAARKSGSQFIYEAFDFNSGLLDGEGNGLFAGVYVLFHTTGLGMTTAEVLKRFPDIKDGDMFITNDPWVGAIHFNDFVVVTPVFSEGEIVAWGAIVMHQQDVGGPVPGSFAVGARDVFDESPIIPPLRLMDGGRYCDEIEALLLRNTRTPMMNALNLRAMVASQVITKRRIHEVIDRYGKSAFKAVTKQIQAEVEQGVKARLAEIPDGEWYEHVYLDHDGNDNELYEVKLRLEKRNEKLIFDFTGTAAQAPGMINCTISGLQGGVMTAVLVTLCYEMPWSTGGLKDIVEIITDEGTVNNCAYPAACSGGSVCGTEATENLAGTAMGKMLGTSEALHRESMAVWYPYFNIVILGGKDQYGGPLAHLLFDNAAGGGGARSRRDGVDCGGYFESVSCVCPNVESNEKVFPVLELFRRRAGTYGHGRFRGGTGIEVGIVSHDIDESLDVVITTHGVAMPGAPGLYGGYPSALNTNVLLRDTGVREQLARGELVVREEQVAYARADFQLAKARTTLGPGDMLLMRNEGGPGYGDPLRREPEAVARDVRDRICSADEARTVYGVVVDADGTLDAAATADERQRIREVRLAESIGVDEAIARYGTEGLALA
jgi:N-methylhydantoinase A/oxoprolinase/acetone carboxylase beta subunit/N-methylhydantoinase B/oxoprolinase/acetone carboxylase alpha subunit